jgi:hypothetical protein
MIVNDIVDRIIALEDITKRTGMKMTRTINQLLQDTPIDVLPEVALELKRRREEACR